MDAGATLRSPAIAAVARSLHIDTVTAEVVEALRRAGAASILLKGPTFARWLYQDGTPRTYTDSDLLIAPESFDAAGEALAGLGFYRVLGTSDHEPLHAELWARDAERVCVDLHRTLWGVSASPAELWDALSAVVDTTCVGDVEVEQLRPAGRAFNAALHAAQHGTRQSGTKEDLARALASCDPAIWEEAAVLAERVEALPAFAAGLSVVPAGERMATRLRLPQSRSVEAALFVDGCPEVTVGLNRLFEAPSLRAKLSLLAREVIPSPPFMRIWSPLARKGRMGLSLAYLWRPLWLLGKTPRALMALRAARRKVRA